MHSGKKILLFFLLSVILISGWFTFVDLSLSGVIIFSVSITLTILLFNDELDDTIELFIAGYGLIDRISSLIGSANREYEDCVIYKDEDIDFVEYCKLLSWNKAFYWIGYARSRKERMFRLGMAVYLVLHEWERMTFGWFLLRNFEQSKPIDRVLSAPDPEFYIFMKRNPRLFYKKIGED